MQIFWHCFRFLCSLMIFVFINAIQYGIDFYIKNKETFILKKMIL